jgi:hypothetical protein
VARGARPFVAPRRVLIERALAVLTLDEHVRCKDALRFGVEGGESCGRLVDEAEAVERVRRRRQWTTLRRRQCRLVGEPLLRAVLQVDAQRLRACFLFGWCVNGGGGGEQEGKLLMTTTVRSGVVFRELINECSAVEWPMLLRTVSSAADHARDLRHCCGVRARASLCWL